MQTQDPRKPNQLPSTGEKNREMQDTQAEFQNKLQGLKQKVRSSSYTANGINNRELARTNIPLTQKTVELINQALTEDKITIESRGVTVNGEYFSYGALNNRNIVGLQVELKLQTALKAVLNPNRETKSTSRESSRKTEIQESTTTQFNETLSSISDKTIKAQSLNHIKLLSSRKLQKNMRGCYLSKTTVQLINQAIKLKKINFNTRGLDVGNDYFSFGEFTAPNSVSVRRELNLQAKLATTLGLQDQSLNIRNNYYQILKYIDSNGYDPKIAHKIINFANFAKKPPEKTDYGLMDLTLSKRRKKTIQQIEQRLGKQVSQFINQDAYQQYLDSK